MNKESNEKKEDNFDCELITNKARKIEDMVNNLSLLHRGTVIPDMRFPMPMPSPLISKENSQINFNKGKTERQLASINQIANQCWIISV